MGNFLKPNDKEYMRMAILKHEETFKEQVYELHRLYRIQKIMMRNIAGSTNGCGLNQSNAFGNIHQKSIVNLEMERNGEAFAAESNGNREVDFTNENEIELTLGPTKYNRVKKHETPLTSDSGRSFSSSSSGSSHLNRTSYLNHQMAVKRREEPNSQSLGLVQVSDRTVGYQSGSKNSFSVEEKFRQGRLKQPPWLFQVLSLNTT